MAEILIIILILLIIQSAYDFLMWFVLNEENPESKISKFLRMSKEILDYPVTVFILLRFGLLENYLLGPVHILLLFYIVKWFHGCDTFYNLYSIFFGKRPCYWGDWRWWTPLGLLRSIFLGRCIIKGYSYIEFQSGSGKFGKYKLPFDLTKIAFSKGMVNVNEAYCETIFAFCAVILYLSIAILLY